MKYATIARYRAEFPLTLMCRVLRVSRAGFYAWQHRQPSPRAQTDAQLRIQVAAFHRRSRQTYGSPRLHRDLQEAGHAVSRKRVARLMREVGLVGTPRRRFRVTTHSDHAHALAPNHLARQFHVLGPDRVWVADLTYVPTGAGWLYLAVVLDLASRRVVGWALEPRLETSLVTTALDHALQTRHPRAGLLHHSDRGRQYASADYQARLRAHGIQCSMSRRGDCWDNAVAESFFASFKRELVHRQRWLTHTAARAAIFEYLEVWYNRSRRHSALGYLSPVAYEARLTSAA